MDIKPPYLLFIGDSIEPMSIKLATSVSYWRPDLALAEMSLDGCSVTTSLPKMGIKAAKQQGVKTFVLGLVNSGGAIAENWIPSILEAIENGMDIASGLHQRLDSFEQIARHAKKHNVKLIDVRHPTQTFNTGTGEPRSGKRLLTVGTDCSSGKMYSALAVHHEMKKRNMSVSFKATGQCGIFIEGKGIAIDCVVSDFISGAVEQLSPETDPQQWDIIEGQGSLYHPAFAGVSMGLIHGAQPDALVLCHVENRQTMRGLNHRELPSIEQVMELNLIAARLTNPKAKFIGLSINTSSMTQSDALKLCQSYEEQFNLPAVDPLRMGVGRLVDQLKE